MNKLQVRIAKVSEQKTLEEIQWEASLNNPGDREVLLINPDAIELPIKQIEAGGVFVAEVEGSILGFAAVLPRDDGNSELDAIFVKPNVWRKGVGRALIKRCCTQAKFSGADFLHVVGNPHAEGFYKSCGFELLGTTQTRFGVGLNMKKSLLLI
ncbi:N-acetyltransferase [Leptospira mtsangambouensis]|uniref:N-acetyltransferase n=1 Tax=Leptospira mtsangambouensis TaxID=2484912 RepID=A0ABY2P4M7_9LEPT|nr:MULTISPECIES: GNAT family N-acetyltransferase [Leptospira]TGL19752.1 N-acetyltransferase [Leptospira bourretii]TGM82428.1 N-acetyltransferase [Leptospira mtsangambouensis]